MARPLPISTSLKLLHVFEAVARLGSFSRAAAELGRAQATVSEQIRDLETQLDVRLIERTTRRLALTAAGEELAAAVSIGFQAIGQGLQAVRIQSDQRRGRLLIACVPSLSGVRLPAMLAAYRRRDRDTLIEVEELSSAEIIDAIAADAIEFGIGPCVDPVPPGIAFTSAIAEPLCALLPLSLTEQNMDAIPFARLIELPLVMLSGSVLLRQRLEETASALGLRLRAQTEVRHVQTAIGMAEAGVGAAIVPSLALPATLDANVVALPIIRPDLSRNVGIITRHGRPLRPAAARLARYVSGALGRARSPIPQTH